jgi:3-isopropylmalate/(R)-2-methylmalate dehydratase large subunit
MTITEKIIAAHCGRPAVEPGEFVMAKVDLAMGNDITAPLAIREIEKRGLPVWDPERVVLVPSHYAPAKDLKSAEMIKVMRDFARSRKIRHFFETGCAGIEHVLLPQKGLTVPGEVVIGADSHSCTYGALGLFSTGVGSTDLAAVMATGEIWLKVPASLRITFHGRPGPWVSSKDMILEVIRRTGVEGANYMAMEFTGEALGALSVDSRLTLCNMAVEAGGKSGICAADGVTIEYVRARSRKAYTVHRSDPDARYAAELDVDVSALEPLVACHPSPDNVKPARALRGLKVDQVFIGSCTNGRLEDLRVAAGILKGRRVHQDLRAIVIPATPEVFLDAMKEGLIDVFVRSGCAVNTSTCGPCLGGHTGVLWDGEKCLSTTNRNFAGRMGSTKAEVYLAGPAVAAATAVAGSIVHPDEVAGFPRAEA